MIDHPAPSPLIGCRVRVPAVTAGAYVRPECEGIVECIDVNTYAVVRLDDGTAHTIHPSALTVLDMPRYRANLDRGREPDAWQVVDASYSYAIGPNWQQPPGGGMVPSGPWEPFAATMYDNGAKCVLWRRPLRRV